MPSGSKSQQALMGMVTAFQKGDLPHASAKVKNVAKHINPSDARDFARTKTKGLPQHVSENDVDYGPPVKAKCPKCGNGWAVNLGKPQGMQMLGCLKCNTTYSPNAGAAPMRESYETGPFDDKAPRDTYQRGTELSKPVRTATNAMASADRSDMGMRRPANQKLSNDIGIIESFNEYGTSFRKAGSMREIAQKLAQVAETAQNHLVNEADDWFDKHTVDRDMKEISKYVGDFGKLAEDYDQLQNRMVALYDDMGFRLGRYFDIKSLEENSPATTVEDKAMGKPFACQECGKQMSAAQAERAARDGCPKCGGVDVDVSEGLGEGADTAPEDQAIAQAQARKAEKQVGSAATDAQRTSARERSVNAQKKLTNLAQQEPKEVDEIDDKDWMTAQDPVRAAQPRNVQNARDFGKHAPYSPLKKEGGYNPAAEGERAAKMDALADQLGVPTRQGGESYDAYGDRLRKAIEQKSLERANLKQQGKLKEARLKEGYVYGPSECQSCGSTRRLNKEHICKTCNAKKRTEAVLPPDGKKEKDPKKDKLVFGQMMREIEQRLMRSMKHENAETSPHNLGPLKITKKQWDNTPAGAKVEIGGRKGIVKPSGFNPAKDIGGGSYVQPVEISKQDANEVGGE